MSEQSLQIVQAVFVVTLENWKKMSAFILFLFSPRQDQGWHLLQFTKALALCVYLWIYWAVNKGITVAQAEIQSWSLFLCLHFFLTFDAEGRITKSFSSSIKPENFLYMEGISRLILSVVALSLCQYRIFRLVLKVAGAYYFWEMIKMLYWCRITCVKMLWYP